MEKEWLMAKIAVILWLFILPFSVNAGWLSASGKVIDISVYEHTDVVVFSISNSKDDSTPCTAKGKTFAINKNTDIDRRKQFLSVLLSAKATGEEISPAPPARE